MIRHWGRYGIAIGIAMPPPLRPQSTIARLDGAVFRLFDALKLKTFVNQPAWFAAGCEHRQNGGRKRNCGPLADQFRNLGWIRGN